MFALEKSLFISQLGSNSDTTSTVSAKYATLRLYLLCIFDNFSFHSAQVPQQRQQQAHEKSPGFRPGKKPRPTSGNAGLAAGSYTQTHSTVSKSLLSSLHGGIAR